MIGHNMNKDKREIKGQSKEHQKGLTNVETSEKNDQRTTEEKDKNKRGVTGQFTLISWYFHGKLNSLVAIYWY